MGRRFGIEESIKSINQEGVLLVFPLNNRAEPRALWHVAHPRKPMRWEWSEDGDDDVVRMWALMKSLSQDRRVVYSKWHQGRATFFSRQVFAALHRVLSERPLRWSEAPPSAREILEVLEMDSPLSTKQLKAATELQGKFFEPTYTKAMKFLFQQLLVVGFGEVEDGAFPSLAVGATSVLFEDLIEESKGLSLKEAQKVLNQYIPERAANNLLQRSSFRKTFDKSLEAR